MIRVAFSPDELEGEERRWWSAWERRSESATQDLLQTGRDGHSYNSRIWKDLKEWFYETVFFRKCAYCEGTVTPTAWGDAEHWRPKDGVSVRQDGCTPPNDEHGAAHPGYWWLAYTWENLLPACQPCNSGGGKGTQFPIQGRYAFRPEDSVDTDDLDRRERPLLLHAIRGEDPAAHLSIDPAGQAFAIADSLIGETSIEVFDLKRSPLRDDRVAQMELVEDALEMALIRVAHEGITLQEALPRWVGPSARYSLAITAHIRRLGQHLDNGGSINDWPLRLTLPHP